MHNSEEINKTVSCYDELITLLFEEDTEMKIMNENSNNEQDIIKLQLNREKNIKDIIETMTKTYNEEADTMQREVSKETSAALETLAHRKQNAADNGLRVKDQLTELSHMASELDHEREVLTQKQLGMEKKITKGLPNSRNDLQLYNHISGVKWEAGSDSHDVKGYISSKNRVKTFSMDSQQYSQFFITNHLWNLLEPDW